MKGWLDKLDAGGKMQEHQPNFNESFVTIPEDYVGEGYNTKGRNYSPAWNGQFANGGFLQPNDPKLPATNRVPYRDLKSSEVAISIGGENGEPAYLIPSFKRGEFLKNPLEEYRKTGEHLGGPFKTWQEADKWDQEIRHPYVEKGQPIPTPLKRWGKDFELGGSVPGANAFMYARHGAPSEGPYAKKTMPSAQGGQEMSFYQQGKDWLPKSMQLGGIVQDDNGYWNPDNWGKPIEINSNQITMQGVNEPLLGISDTGDKKMMLPGKDYKFKGKKVQEFPILKNGNQLQKLDQLQNFNNFGQSSKWLDKYK